MERLRRADVTALPAGRGGLQASGQLIMVTLTLKEPFTVPLEAEVLSPDLIAPLTNAEIRALPVYLGKRQRRVDDFFTVEGDGSDEIEIHGDLGKVKWIGRGMTRGQRHGRRQRRHAPGRAT